MSLHVQLFGRFGVELDGRALGGLEARKVQELLSYLLIYRDRPHPRETLAGILWDAQSTPQSKKYLRQALWQLQNALQSVGKDDFEPILIIESEWIQINPKANIHLDVHEFEEAFKDTRGLRGRELVADQITALTAAVGSYQNDMLPGWYQDWCIFERERLQNMFIAIMDKLMGYCEAHGNYEEGISYGMRILGFDRARERTHRRLMRLHYLADDRTGALRQYKRCEAALEEELGVKPAKRTDELYTLVVDDQPISTYLLQNYSEQIVGTVTETILDLPKTTTHLKRLQNLLIDVQQSVIQDIESIESALNSD